MGLALYDSSDPLVGMTQALREERHVSRIRAPRPPRHPPKVRHTKCDCGYGGYAKIPIREHNALKDAHWLHARPQPNKRHCSSSSSSSFFPSPFNAAHRSDIPIAIPRQRPRSRVAWATYVNEGVDLQPAGSSDGLSPSAPRRQARRPPSLERQDAFRDPSSSTPWRRRSADDYFGQEVDVSGADAAAALAAEEIADLYDLGLLYDDEHVRGSGFGFDVLTRNAQEQPQYNVRFRRAAGQNSKSFGRRNARRLEQLQNHIPSAVDAADHLTSPDGEELEWCSDDFDVLSNQDGSVLVNLGSDSDDECAARSTDWVLLNKITEED
ncbi:uncharacterized protein PpBr36_10254 [Pyricularia pennisetigena]|uniref:uncharacterized protein n=1 Tax=Pyricularia pennisetigena TaxID=1578925 RepID=UPI001154DF8F|nr:uncharacterized protein PpBr36_10254 [Pyricularia pennisetigena]TLS21540.1 hypothetical protein PpBr36_10254 [Pyricularia pennisetigena]